MVRPFRRPRTRVPAFMEWWCPLLLPRTNVEQEFDAIGGKSLLCTDSGQDSEIRSTPLLPADRGGRPIFTLDSIEIFPLARPLILRSSSRNRSGICPP